jgi:hypothetical protein
MARIGEAAKHEPELRLHLEEIVQGSAFKGSHRSQVFLRHIVEQALHGDPAELRERNIGMALFGRPATYDTADDAIVRVTASDVRKRLLQHYGNGGRESRLRISLPAGSYLPEFSIAAEPPRVVEPAPAAPTPLPVPAKPHPAEPRSATLPRYALAALATLLFLVVAGMFWWYGPRLLRRDGGGNLILASFQGTPKSVQVVVADDALVLIQVLLDRRFTLAEYENLAYLNLPEMVQRKELIRFWNSLSTRQITNVGDLQNATRIAGVLQAGGWDPAIRQARQMHARSFRSGNYVILGSSFSNPWADLFTVKDSNFPLDGLPAPGKPEVILNRNPQNGEPAKFEALHDVRTGKKTTFCRVTLVHNAGQTSRVLLVAGQSMSATEMAGELLLRDGSAAQARRMLKLRSGDPLPDLEMILRVTEQNEVGDSVELVACRKVPLALE